MGRIPTRELSSYLLTGRVFSRDCTRLQRLPARNISKQHFAVGQPAQRRWNHTAPEAGHTTTTQPPPGQPAPHLRKILKDQAKAAKAQAKGKKKRSSADNQTVPGWELTVGIEIHAQLNTDRKLFSPAPLASTEDNTRAPAPNSLVAPFDLAIPGTQPLFQQATLVPAIRAAVALNCAVQPVSSFDRKHYFHWDQPSGYQITQYYAPLARDGYVELRARDGIAAQDVGGGEPLRIRVKQVQMEQDTAKTLARPDGVHWLDFNRCGAPLVEIISEPDIHHPATAAAFVRKVQMLLGAADACVVGMEKGGLRADVNVSVRRVEDGKTSSAKLGQRTEIKNLFSFKAVEDAIIAERDRQIKLLDEGGVVLGETRGWSLGSTETRRLRGKEGEVDYRYMPDPDLGPVLVGQDVVEHLKSTMGVMPDQELDDLVSSYGLSEKDAMSLMLLEDGGRLQFYYKTVDALEQRLQNQGDSAKVTADSLVQARILTGNWILHVLGSLTSENNQRDRAAAGLSERDLGVTSEGDAFISADDLADILFFLHTSRIRQGTAKDLLFAMFNEVMPAQYISTPAGIERYITDNDLWFSELSPQEYSELAESVLDEEEHVLKELMGARYPQGKLMFLVGMMMKSGARERIDPATAQKVMRDVVETRVAAMK